MKTILRMQRMTAGLLVSLGVLFLAIPRSYALFGVGDVTFTTQTADLTWPVQLAQWTKLITETTKQVNEATNMVNRADELIRIAGDPRRALGMLLADVTSVLDPSGEVAAFQTAGDVFQLMQSVDDFKYAVDRTVVDANRVGPNYRAFGKFYERDKKRFTQYAIKEALYQRYRDAIAQKEKVDKLEFNLQRKLLAQMKNGEQAEVGALQAALAASKQRQDMAHQKVEQTRGEIDSFQAKLNNEDGMRQAADREWAETVVRDMRERAVATFSSSE